MRAQFCLRFQAVALDCANPRVRRVGEKSVVLLVRAHATEAMQCKACEEQVKACMREKKNHMSRSNIASYAWLSIAQHSDSDLLLARVAREMFDAARAPKPIL